MFIYMTLIISRMDESQSISENLKKAIEARRQAKAEASKPVATETVTASKPKRTRIRKKKVAAESSGSAAKTGKKVRRRTSQKKTA